LSSARRPQVDAANSMVEYTYGGQAAGNSFGGYSPVTVEEPAARAAGRSRYRYRAPRPSDDRLRPSRVAVGRTASRRPGKVSKRPTGVDGPGSGMFALFLSDETDARYRAFPRSRAHAQGWRRRPPSRPSPRRQGRSWGDLPRSEGAGRLSRRRVGQINLGVDQSWRAVPPVARGDSPILPSKSGFVRRGAFAAQELAETAMADRDVQPSMPKRFVISH